MATFVLLLDLILRVALIVLTILSFYPQLRRIGSRGDAYGINLWYLVLIAAATLQPFGILLPTTVCKVIDHSQDPIHVAAVLLPEWLDFVQVVILAVCMLVWLLYRIVYPPRSIWQNILALTLYVAFAVFAILPGLTEKCHGDNHSIGDINMWVWLYSVVTSLPAILGIIAAGLVQANITYGRRQSDALSLTSLGAQAITLWVVAASWAYRVSWWDVHQSPRLWNPFERIGFWFAIGMYGLGSYLALAIVQGSILWVACKRLRHESRDEEAVVGEEAGGEESAEDETVWPGRGNEPSENTPLLTA